MTKYIKLRRRVYDRYDGDQFEIEKIGEDTYRITTGEPEEHDFRNRIRAERFDDEFVSKFNAASEQEDQFDLHSSDAYRVLTELRKKLERGDNEIRLRVRE